MELEIEQEEDDKLKEGAIKKIMDFLRLSQKHGAR